MASCRSSDGVRHVTRNTGAVFLPRYGGQQKRRFLVPQNGNASHLPTVHEVRGIPFGNAGQIHLPVDETCEKKCKAGHFKN